MKMKRRAKKTLTPFDLLQWRTLARVLGKVTARTLIERWRAAKSDDESREWKHALVVALIESASFSVGTKWWDERERADCPVCGGRAYGDFAKLQGYTREGLRRHFERVGNSSPCATVVAVLDVPDARFEVERAAKREASKKLFQLALARARVGDDDGR